MPLPIVQLNLAYDPAIASPADLLARYRTLTGWSRAVAAAGARVHVVQRFGRDARVERDEAAYEFVGTASPGTLSPWAADAAVVEAVRTAGPDVVHVNGLMFPGMVAALREALARSAIVLQDHSGYVPRSRWRPDVLGPSRWRRVFGAVDAATFTAAELAAPWERLGLAREQVLEIPEAGTDLAPVDRDEARLRTGIAGSPAIVWLGRLDANKDPLTVLSGLESAFDRLPHARCWMIGTGDLEPHVRRRVDRSATLRGRVVLTGEAPHDAIAAMLSAADIFVSGSHHEGSGYALIEALACGAVPCVTDIPAFRALAGSCGMRWPPGDHAACADALVAIAARDRGAGRAAARQRFDEALAWDVIGRRTLAAYEALARRRAEASGG